MSFLHRVERLSLKASIYTARIEKFVRFVEVEQEQILFWPETNHTIVVRHNARKKVLPR